MSEAPQEFQGTVSSEAAQAAVKDLSDKKRKALLGRMQGPQPGTHGWCYKNCQYYPECDNHVIPNGKCPRHPIEID